MATDHQMLKAVEDLNRTLKQVVSALNDQTRVLKKLSPHILKDQTTSDEVEDKPVVVPEPTSEVVDIKRTYGWSMAASVQREGGLNIGDQKIEQDDSRWIWTGEAWERIELPSGQT